MRPAIPLLLTLCLGLSCSVSQAYPPFFDDEPATRHAPPDPELTDFDLEVLSLCGGWGRPVEARDFERMLMRPENLAVTERMREALGSRIYGRAEDTREFVRQLRRAWFEQKGFAHVFCGEPGVGRDLGGFHYAPRYWQAQDEGWAGYRKLAKDWRRRPEPKCRKSYLRERIRPPIFNISVRFNNPKDPREDVKCLSGYHREMHAERLLIAGTRALKQANKRLHKNDRESCLYQTRVPGVEPHYNQAVINRRALRTFYPLADKKPYCRKNPADVRACLCSKL